MVSSLLSKLFGILILRFFIAVNVIEFSLFAWDKLQAFQRGHRVAESSFLAWAYLGGAPAAFLASRVFNHKRRKYSLQSKMGLLFLSQAFVEIYVFHSIWSQYGTSAIWSTRGEDPLMKLFKIRM